jgi:hypothetical protein
MYKFFLQKWHLGAMETRDHSKNGASPKSHTIRENFILFVLIVLSISSCSPYMLLTTSQREMIGENFDRTFKGGKGKFYLDSIKGFDIGPIIKTKNCLFQEAVF